MESKTDVSTKKRPLLKLLEGGGRLGDQLFMYASQLGLAKTHDMDSCMVKTDQRLTIEQMFVGPIEWCDDEEYDIEWVGGWRSEKVSQLRRVDDDADLVYGLSGYMHSPRNFVAAKTPSGDFVDYSDLLYEKLTLKTDAEWQDAIQNTMEEGERYEDESTEVIRLASMFGEETRLMIPSTPWLMPTTIEGSWTISARNTTVIANQAATQRIVQEHESSFTLAPTQFPG